MQNIFKIEIRLMRVNGSRTSVLYSKATIIVMQCDLVGCGEEQQICSG
jgi:hypothetical protein